MPTVPRRTEQSVAPAAAPRITTQTNAPIEAFGGGQELTNQANITKDIIKLGVQKHNEKVAAQVASDKAANDFFMEVKKDVDKTSVMAASNEAAKAAAEAELAYRNLKGMAALTDGRKVLDETWNNSISSIRENLSNDDQRLAFDIDQEARYGKLTSEQSKYSNDEYRKYQDEVSKNGLKIAQEQVASDYTNLKSREDGFNRIQVLTREEGERKGWSPERLQQELLERGSKAHSMIIDQMLIDELFTPAKDYQDRFRKLGEITTDDLEKISNNTRQARLAKQERLEQEKRARQLGIIDGLYDSQQNLEDFRNPAKEMSTSEFESNKKAFKKKTDDRLINRELKTTAYINLVKMIEDLGGEASLGFEDPFDIELQRSGIGQGDKVRGILDLRSHVMENRDLYKDKTIKDVFDMTENALKEDSERALKGSIFQKLKNTMGYISSFSNSYKKDSSEVYISTMSKLMDPKTSAKEAEGIVDEAMPLVNPEMGKYPVGTIFYQSEEVTIGGKTRIMPRTVTINGYKDGKPTFVEGAKLLKDGKVIR